MTRRERKRTRVEGRRKERRQSVGASGWKRWRAKQRELGVEKKNSKAVERAAAENWRSDRLETIQKALQCIPLDLIRLIHGLSQEPYFFILDCEGWVTQWTIGSAAEMGLHVTARVYSFPGVWKRACFSDYMVATTNYLVTNTTFGQLRIWNRETLEYLHTITLPCAHGHLSEEKIEKTNAVSMTHTEPLEYVHMMYYDIDVLTAHIQTRPLPQPPTRLIQVPALNGAIHPNDYGYFNFNCGGQLSTHNWDDNANWKYSKHLVLDTKVVFGMTATQRSDDLCFQAALFVFDCDCKKRDFIAKFTLTENDIDYTSPDPYQLEHCISFIPDIPAIVSAFGSLITLLSWPQLEILQRCRLFPDNPHLYASNLAA